MTTPTHCQVVTASFSQAQARATTMMSCRLPVTVWTRGPISRSAQHCATLRMAAVIADRAAAPCVCASAARRRYTNSRPSTFKATGVRVQRHQMLLQATTRRSGIWSRSSCCHTHLKLRKTVARPASRNAVSEKCRSPFTQSMPPEHTTMTATVPHVAMPRRPKTTSRAQVEAGVQQPIIATKATPPKTSALLSRASARPFASATGSTRMASWRWGGSRREQTIPVRSMCDAVIE
mmetsp:Transcript_3949/g.11436  ORF Transcript_3949/g.11436 Transcript_3949/m.11436 type:complete len:235 (-) Transcript_3949:502-1206(-)